MNRFTESPAVQLPNRARHDRVQLSPIAKHRLGGMLVAGVLGATGWALGSGIVEGANTSKLQGQLERKARDVKKDYVAGRIDQSKVEAVTVGAPISAYNEAVKIVKNPQDTPTVSEIITAQDGPALSGGEIPILPAELIKPPETPPSK